MPTYTFLNLENGIEYDITMPMSDYDQYLEDNNVQRVFQPVALSADHLMGVGPKNDSGFNDVMKNIASKHPDSPMADKYGSGKSTKRLQAENIYKKHKKR
tara:strand:+ start:1533 stop:1832 length:300 start_codon:yes stop_codon:yes gene_type:complete